MYYRSWLAFVLSSALVVACGGGDGDDVGGGGGNEQPDAGGGGSDGGGGDDFEVLAAGEWTLPAGTEDYICIYYTLPETVYAKAFRPMIPEGTHHSVVTIGSPQRPDGVERCEPQTNYFTMVFGSGVGTNAFYFPDGVATKIEKGQQVLINLHLFNFSDQELSGVSGTEIIAADPADVDFEAEALMVSEFELDLPPQQETTVTGSCPMNGDVNLISASPHMHVLGTHFKLVAESSIMGDVAMLDEAYNFDEQTITVMNPEIPMQEGDHVRIECTYNNTTDQPVGWGDSSLDEMCIAALYRYPARGARFICSDSF